MHSFKPVELQNKKNLPLIVTLATEEMNADLQKLEIGSGNA